jgi:hypothetical protein
MKMKKIILIPIVFVFLAGCGSYELRLREGEAGIEHYHYNLSLDKALTLLQERHPDYNDKYYYYGLEFLLSQAYQDDDKEIIEKEMLTVLLKRINILRQKRQEQREGSPFNHYNYDSDLSHEFRKMDVLRRYTTSEEVKSEAASSLSELRQAERVEEEERERKERRKERKRVEFVRAEFERSRERLTKISKGTLKDKSAQEVKKLVDEWRQRSLSLELPSKEYLAFFSAGTFYKIFGKPERKQFLSSSGLVTADSYIFYYNCKDGIVQIQVSAVGLDDDGIVLIRELNIF